MSFPCSPSSDTSVGDLDLSLLKQVKLAIQRVAETQGDTVTEQPTSPSRLRGSAATSSRVTVPELEAQCVECRDEIEKLREEIRLLGDELERKEAPLALVTDDHIERHLLALEDSALLEGSGEMPECVTLLKSRTTLNASLTGIKFKSVDWEVTRTDQLGLLRTYDHIGTAHGFEFRVQFVVREEKDPISKSDVPVFARIIGLRVKVDSRLEKHLTSLLTQCSSECDLMAFYQTYSKFCSSVKQRRKTLHELQKAHGKCVHVNNDQLAHRLQFTIGSGLVLNFVWDITLAEDRSVNQSLSLTTKLPSNACDEEREYLARLPRLLRKMVEFHGCRETLVRTLQELNPLSEQL